jgi:hypothetical protein
MKPLKILPGQEIRKLISFYPELEEFAISMKAEFGSPAAVTLDAAGHIYHWGEPRLPEGVALSDGTDYRKKKKK